MKVSIITVVYNNQDTVRDCMTSVFQQTHSDIEYIIVDGNSTDGTKDVINEYADQLAHFVSEPDDGLYDAMNKGIALSSGDIVGILNSDDFYVDSDVIAEVVEAFEKQDAGCVYGDVCYVGEEDPNEMVRYWRAGRFGRHKIPFGWMPPHQAFFVRRELYQRHGTFSLELDIAADYELMFRLLYHHRETAHHVPRVLTHAREGGVSNQSLGHRLRGHRQVHQAWAMNGYRSKRLGLWLKPLSKLPQYWVRPATD